MANVEKDLRYYQPRRNNLQLGVSVSEAVSNKRENFPFNPGLASVRQGSLPQPSRPVCLRRFY